MAYAVYFAQPRSAVAHMCLALLTGLLCWPGAVAAHVKWFEPYDLSQQPVSPMEFMCQGTWMLGFALSLPLLWLCVGTDSMGSTVIAPRLFARIRRSVATPDIWIRIALGVWLSWLWLLPSPVWLTPELSAENEWIQWVQLVFALSCLSRQTVWLAGIGLLLLWLGAAREYGFYHLLDYPLFLGFGFYTVAISIRRFRIRVLMDIAARRRAVLNVAMAWTLMWASVEKWAYPDWSLPLLREHPYIAMGMEPKHWLILAGWVEFGAAATLVLGGRLSSRIAALVLACIFLLAIVDFGRIDLVGHLPIIAALGMTVLFGNELRAIAEHGQARRWIRQGVIVTIMYYAALAFFIVIYTHGWFLTRL